MEDKKGEDTPTPATETTTTETSTEQKSADGEKSENTQPQPQSTSLFPTHLMSYHSFDPLIFLSIYTSSTTKSQIIVNLIFHQIPEITFRVWLSATPFRRRSTFIGLDRSWVPSRSIYRRTKRSRKKKRRIAKKRSESTHTSRMATSGIASPTLDQVCVIMASIRYVIHSHQYWLI